MNKLYKKDSGEWCLCKYILKYTKNGEVCEQLADDIEWFRTFADMNVDFTIDEVVTLEYTDAQLARLIEIKDYKFEDFEELADYVVNGVIKVDSVIFANKILQKDQKWQVNRLDLMEADSVAFTDYILETLGGM